MIEIFCALCNRKLAETPNKKNEFEISCPYCHCINTYNKGILYTNTKRMIKKDFVRVEEKLQNRSQGANKHRSKVVNSMLYGKAEIQNGEKFFNLIMYLFKWRLPRLWHRLPPR